MTNKYFEVNNMHLPNFLCIGVQKAGTTTLYDILKQHPEIYLPKTKEIHFFDKKKVNFLL